MEQTPGAAVFTEQLKWGTVVAVAAAVLFHVPSTLFTDDLPGPAAAPDAALAADGALRGVGLDVATGAVLAMVYAVYRMYMVPNRIRSKNFHDPRHPRFQAMRE